MIRRLIVGGLAAAALLVPAAGAQAAVTRNIQAFDTPSFTHLWTPRNVPAQVGDTIQWKFTQPGNSLASVHDLWLVAPGGQPQQLGASYLGATATTVLSQPGTYQFYCSIHGGLTAGGMNGQLVVGTTDPGAPVDPGTPWTDPNWQDPDDPSLPASLPNTTTAPTVFEEGDTTAPTVDVVSVKAPQNTVKVKANVSEAGTLTLRLKLGKKIVATEIVDANAGLVSAQIKPPKNLRDKERKYKLQIFATDMAEIDSEIHSVWVYLGG